MGTLKKVTQKITYKVPAGQHCNLINPYTLQPTATKCRFCVGSNAKGYTCLMHNIPLGMTDRNLVDKCPRCAKPSMFNPMDVVDISDQALSNNEPMVDPKKAIKMAIEEYIKVKHQLDAQGYPTAMAEKIAKEYLLKGLK